MITITIEQYISANSGILKIVPIVTIDWAVEVDMYLIFSVEVKRLSGRYTPTPYDIIKSNKMTSPENL